MSAGQCREAAAAGGRQTRGGARRRVEAPIARRQAGALGAHVCISGPSRESRLNCWRSDQHRNVWEPSAGVLSACAVAFGEGVRTLTDRQVPGQDVPQSPGDRANFGPMAEWPEVG